jgi:ketosteroid isomerase-like protein
MNITRRHLTGPLPVLGLITVGLLGAGRAVAMTGDEDAVAKKLEAFRAAQMAKDGKALEALILPELSYSHSSAVVQDKAEFLKGATDPASKFLSLEYKDPTIKVVGDAAIVRFHWVAESETIADSKQSSTSLAVLMTWLKRGGTWKLLDRASTKV